MSKAGNTVQPIAHQSFSSRLWFFEGVGGVGGHVDSKSSALS